MYGKTEKRELSMVHPMHKIQQIDALRRIGKG